MGRPQNSGPFGRSATSTADRLPGMEGNTMTAIVWVNLALAVPFLIAFIGVPLWMTFRTPQTGPGHAQAHAYLRARTALGTPPGGTAAGDHAGNAARHVPAAA